MSSQPTTPLEPGRRVRAKFKRGTFVTWRLGIVVAVSGRTGMVSIRWDDDQPGDQVGWVAIDLVEAFS